MGWTSVFFFFLVVNFCFVSWEDGWVGVIGAARAEWLWYLQIY